MPVCAAITTLRPMLHVVADVNQIVELGPAANPGFFERPAVDGGVGSHLNIVLNDQRTLLGKLGVLPGRAIADIAEAIGSQHRPGVDHHPVSERGARVDDHPGVDVAIAADSHAGADHRSAVDDGPGADTGSLLDRGVGADRDTRRNLHAGRKHRRRVDGRRGRGVP